MRAECVRLFQAALIFLCYLFLILCPAACSAAAVDALRLCAQVLTPSLFPFFVCSNLFCALGLTALLEKPLRGVMQPLFGLSGAGAAALLPGLMGGYPAGAQAVATLYQSGSMDKAQAERLLRFCNNCGPAFIFGVAAQAVGQSPLAGLLLYLVQVLSALALGLAGRRKSAPPGEETHAQISASTPLPFSAAMTESVRKAGQSMLEVCMFALTFGVLAAMVRLLAARLFPPEAVRLFSGALELACGMQALGAMQASQGVKFVLCSFFLAFGGLSVHAQTRSVLRAAQLAEVQVFRPKLLQGLLAALLGAVGYALAAPELLAAQTAGMAFSPGAAYAAALLLTGAACVIFRKMAGSNFARHRV